MASTASPSGTTAAAAAGVSNAAAGGGSGVAPGGGAAAAGAEDAALLGMLTQCLEGLFSDAGLAGHPKLLAAMKKQPQGFITAKMLLEVDIVKALGVTKPGQVAAAARKSSKLVVNKAGTMVRKNAPLKGQAGAASKVFAPTKTLFVDRLGEEDTEESLRNMFEAVSSVTAISVLPAATKRGDSHAAAVNTARAVLKGMGHRLPVSRFALVALDTAEATASALAIYADDQSWRGGMRVMGSLKHGGKKPGNQFTQASGADRAADIAAAAAAAEAAAAYVATLPMERPARLNFKLKPRTKGTGGAGAAAGAAAEGSVVWKTAAGPVHGSIGFTSRGS